MILRISVLLALLTWGALAGGWIGMFYMLFFFGLVALFFPYRGKPAQEATGSPQTPSYDVDAPEYRRAIRGERIAYSGSRRDPTRPR